MEHKVYFLEASGIVDETLVMESIEDADTSSVDLSKSGGLKKQKASSPNY